MEFALVLRMVGACAVIALVLAGVQYAARASIRLRFQPGTRRKLLTLVETAYLPNAASLHVVRAAERYYVIGRSGTHITTLCEIPAESIVARPAEPVIAAGISVAGRSLFAGLRRRRS